MVLAPIGQSLINGFGWKAAMWRRRDRGVDGAALASHP